MAKNDKIEPETPNDVEDNIDIELLKELEAIQETISNKKMLKNHQLKQRKLLKTPMC